MRPIYSWPPDLIPTDARFQMNSHTQDGFISRSSFENEVRIPGGRVSLHLEFQAPQTDKDGELYSWLISVAKGSILAIDTWQFVQTGQDKDFGLGEAPFPSGIPYSYGQFHSSGQGFAFAPQGIIVKPALKGDNQIIIDETLYPGALRLGKWFSLNYAPYMVEAIDITRFRTTVTVTPPLLNDYDAGTKFRLIPRGGFKIDDISSFSQNFRLGRWATPGSVKLTQVIDDRLL